MNNLQIEKVIGREIIDSRGNPTVEAEVVLADGTIALYDFQTRCAMKSSGAGIGGGDEDGI